jgi:hypothetical protein
MIKTLLILTLFAIPAFGQTKWVKFFETESADFYYRTITETKPNVVDFEGRLVTEKEDAITTFRLLCAERKVFLISGEIGGKKTVLQKPIPVEIVESSAIEAAFGIGCGKEE